MIDWWSEMIVQVKGKAFICSFKSFAIVDHMLKAEVFRNSEHLRRSCGSALLHLSNLQGSKFKRIFGWLVVLWIGISGAIASKAMVFRNSDLFDALAGAQCFISRLQGSKKRIFGWLVGISGAIAPRKSGGIPKFEHLRRSYGSALLHLSNSLDCRWALCVHCSGQ